MNAFHPSVKKQVCERIKQFEVLVGCTVELLREAPGLEIGGLWPTIKEVTLKAREIYFKREAMEVGALFEPSLSPKQIHIIKQIYLVRLEEK